MMRSCAKCGRVLFIVDGNIKGEYTNLKNITDEKERERGLNNWLLDLDGSRFLLKVCYRLTYDMLRRTKNCREIIESASRPNENLDKRLTFDGFQAWYLERAGLLGE